MQALGKPEGAKCLDPEIFSLWKAEILKDNQDILTTAGFFLLLVCLKAVHTVLSPISGRYLAGVVILRCGIIHMILS